MNTQHLLSRFENCTDAEKWDVRFPMGVFGTLRQGWGNHPLMGYKDGVEIEDDSVAWRMQSSCNYLSHHKAFLPHFVAVDLSIHHQPGSSAVFEIYTYDAANWDLMIPSVDRLEGFSPDNIGGGYSYHRTLVWMRVLPKDFQHPHFDRRRQRDWGRRTLEILKMDWEQYPKMPCWVYSSLDENTQNKRMSDTPIIWDGSCND